MREKFSFNQDLLHLVRKLRLYELRKTVCNISLNGIPDLLPWLYLADLIVLVGKIVFASVV